VANQTVSRQSSENWCGLHWHSSEAALQQGIPPTAQATERIREDTLEIGRILVNRHQGHEFITALLRWSVRLQVALRPGWAVINKYAVIVSISSSCQMIVNPFSMPRHRFRFQNTKRFSFQLLREYDDNDVPHVRYSTARGRFLGEFCP
jgi:hypothetical protein